MTTTLKNGQWLQAGDSLWSEDGSVELKMHEDGKLAVYWDGECRFQSNDGGHDNINGVVIQDDGNFVIYDHDGNSVWSSDTHEVGDDSVEVAVQNDGNIVLYAIWATNTCK